MFLWNQFIEYHEIVIIMPKTIKLVCGDTIFYKRSNNIRRKKKDNRN